MFCFLPLPEKSPEGPRKGPSRPDPSHPEVAKGRPEVLERSQDGSGKVTRRTQKIGSEEPLGYPLWGAPWGLKFGKVQDLTVAFLTVTFPVV